ncbi:hypothetical protein LTR51_006712 [Lithohypha guttulata]|nr:hypothetical protein LTR51_006712 [Lithohypha guttulata]
MPIATTYSLPLSLPPLLQHLLLPPPTIPTPRKPPHPLIKHPLIPTQRHRHKRHVQHHPLPQRAHPNDLAKLLVLGEEVCVPGVIGAGYGGVGDEGWVEAIVEVGED